MIPCPARMQRRLNTEGSERFSAHPVPGNDGHGVGADGFVVGQLTAVTGRRHRPPLVRRGRARCPRRSLARARPTRSATSTESWRTTVSRSVSWRNRGGVEPHRVRDDLDDSPIGDLIAVAEGAVDDSTAPLLGETVDLWELVDEAGGGEDTASHDRVAADQLDSEVGLVEAGHLALRSAPPRRSCGLPLDRRRSDRTAERLRIRGSCACARRGRCGARRRR